MGHEDAESSQMAQDVVPWKVLVNTVMNRKVHKRGARTE